jgi:hypothetical protein
VRSCWILAGTGTRCCTRRSRASQTCSMGDMSGEYAGHGRTWNIFSFRELWTDSCDTSLALYWNRRWWQQMNATTMDHRISSRYLCIQISIDKMQLCSLSIAYASPYHNPTTTMGCSFYNFDFKKGRYLSQLYNWMPSTEMCGVVTKLHI